MKDIFKRKSKSYAAVEHVLDKYPDAVGSTVILKNGATSFKAKLRSIEIFQVPEPWETALVRKDKISLMDAAGINVETERNAILLYAADKGLAELAGKMPRTESELNEGSEEERWKRYQKVHTEAKNLGDALAPFGSDPAAITELDEQLPILRERLDIIQDAISDRVQLNKDFRKAYTDMDTFLKESLDKAAKTRLKSFPVFVSEYFKARKLPKSPTRNEEAESAKVAASNLPQTSTSGIEGEEEVNKAVVPSTGSESVSDPNGAGAAGENA